MILFAHHVAVELFGREFSPHTPLEHACAFVVAGTLFALAGYVAWTQATKARAYLSARARRAA